jgi:hypothetical protein
VNEAEHTVRGTLRARREGLAASVPELLRPRLLVGQRAACARRMEARATLPALAEARPKVRPRCARALAARFAGRANGERDFAGREAL